MITLKAPTFESRIPTGALYWDGEEFVDKTGGFTSTADKPSNYTSPFLGMASNIERGVQDITFTLTGQSSSSYASASRVAFLNKIDLTNFSTIHVIASYDVTVNSSSHNSYFSLSFSDNLSNVNTELGDLANIAVPQSHTIVEDKESIIDISSISGQKYLFFYVVTDYYVTQTKWIIKKVWLE